MACTKCGYTAIHEKGICFVCGQSDDLNSMFSIKEFIVQETDDMCSATLDITICLEHGARYTIDVSVEECAKTKTLLVVKLLGSTILQVLNYLCLSTDIVQQEVVDNRIEVSVFLNGIGCKMSFTDVVDVKPVFNSAFDMFLDILDRQFRRPGYIFTKEF